MVDKLTVAQRSVNMSRIRSRGTKPELAVRKMVFSMGYRFRLHKKELPGSPDLVFKGRKKVIFVHGCFWHSHQKTNCLDSRTPKSNVSYWSTKLARNKQRDQQNEKALRETGWDILTIWECEIKQLSLLEARIKQFLG